MFKAIDNFFSKMKKEAEQRERAAKQKQEAEERRIAHIRTIPTSSTNQLKGHRIERQVKFVSVSNHKDPAAAEFDFREKVVAAGGSGAINVKIRHHAGGYVSVQGDAVVIG